MYDNYKVGKSLGFGTYGEVFLCTHYDTNEERAVKWVKRELLSSQARASLEAEINILKDLDYPNIVRVFEYFEDA